MHTITLFEKLKIGAIVESVLLTDVVWFRNILLRHDAKFPSELNQLNQLPKAKKEFPNLKRVPSQVLQQTIKQLHRAWDFFRERGYGFPRFKKFGQFKSILFPQFKESPLTPLRKGGKERGIWQINLPKIGKVRINVHRPIPEGFKALASSGHQKSRPMVCFSLYSIRC